MSTVEQRLKQFPTRKNRYPAVPEPLVGADALRASVDRLKERVETYARERGNVLDSFISIQDAIDLGLIGYDGVPTHVRLSETIAALEARIAALEGP